MAEKEKTNEGGGGDGQEGQTAHVTVGNTYRKIALQRGWALADLIEFLKKEGLLPNGISQFTIRLNDTFIRHTGDKLETNPVLTETCTLSFLLKFKGGKI
ncbi:MAG: hypothetical protein Q7S28_03830 [bacterium]|nr:hypothetical protein [bacterium]